MGARSLGTTLPRAWELSGCTAQQTRPKAPLAGVGVDWRDLGGHQKLGDSKTKQKYGVQFFAGPLVWGTARGEQELWSAARFRLEKTERAVAAGEALPGSAGHSGHRGLRTRQPPSLTS
jgi:hypothetical protein